MYSQLKEEWNSICSADSSLASLLEEKVSPLLNHDEEEYVVQGIELLLQCGSCSLVLILEEKEGSFDISEKYSENVQVVERCVIGEVSKEYSKWFGLFENGFFDGMYLRTMENTDWNELSDTLQQRLLKEVGKMKVIDPCTFMMGALDDDEEADDDEKPRHEVILTRRFAIGKYQVTQGLWESVMGSNPSEFKGSSRPVEQVSWFDCVEFCNKLSEKEGLEKAYTINGEEVQCNFESNGYRLPTEAEWECAARGGEVHLYSGSDNFDEVAWTSDNSNDETHGVGQKKRNGFGLYDMSGNVDEWCWDEGLRDYEAIPTEDSTGPSTGSFRGIRGGSWFDDASCARISLRYEYHRSSHDDFMGFRLIRTIQ